MPLDRRVRCSLLQQGKADSLWGNLKTAAFSLLRSNKLPRCRKAARTFQPVGAFSHAAQLQHHIIECHATDNAGGTFRQPRAAARRSRCDRMSVSSCWVSEWSPAQLLPSVGQQPPNAHLGMSSAVCQLRLLSGRPASTASLTALCSDGVFLLEWWLACAGRAL